MSPLYARTFVRRLLLACVVALSAGCGRSGHGPAAGGPHAPGPQAAPFPPGPPTMELSDPKVTFRDPETVECEVKYRFTQGGPQPHDAYDFQILFPGTQNSGLKLMHTWELKMEGTIKDSFHLSQPGAKTFEIFVTETATLDRPGRKQISNVVRGPIR